MALSQNQKYIIGGVVLLVVAALIIWGIVALVNKDKYKNYKVGGYGSHVGYQSYVDDVAAGAPTCGQLARTATGGFDKELHNFPTAQHWQRKRAGMQDEVRARGAAGISAFGSQRPVERGDLVAPCAQNAPTFIATDLLPKESSALQQQQLGLPTWGEGTSGNVLAAGSFLSPSGRIGIPTVTSQLKNASHDLRGDPVVNNQQSVSPWNNSTILPDLTRRPLQCPTDPVSDTAGIYSCNAAKSSSCNLY